MEHQRYLIVEDNRDFAAGLANLLSIYDIETTIARFVREALDCVKDQPFDVAVIDIKLGEDSGFDVLCAIQDRDPGTKCVMISGDAIEKYRKEALELGALAVLSKPFGVTQIFELVGSDTA